MDNDDIIERGGPQEGINAYAEQNGATNPTTPQADEELEAELAQGLRHTLKLVPSRQRELFVFELARFIKDRDEQREREIREKSHREGYSSGVYDFENYFMDASIPAQRIPIGRDIAQELVRDYKYPYSATMEDFTYTQSSKGETK